ncbi:hypothetical protein SAMN02745135_01975 [Caloranaerobacter azorensis DSM 13643]|uniref:Uncharacterized protein n=1 Tax=Caloranaerobacter azorensis DSM 13643 TaxID=1121264 RepID=A0A1M5VJZ9_9FIRM|nr:hypothetical protein SAMN02745135_01975 [Caloranaerobacter azorensis DSM 13643]
MAMFSFLKNLLNDSKFKKDLKLNMYQIIEIERDRIRAIVYQ